MIVSQRHFLRVDWVVLVSVIARTPEVISLLVGADEVIGVILLVVTDAVVRPMASIGVKILEGAGK